MKNLYRSIVLTMALVAPMVSGAATFTLTNSAGADFPGTNNLGNSTNSGASTRLPSSGVFTDTWNFLVGAGGGGSTAGSVINISNAAVANIINMSAKVDGVSFTPIASSSVVNAFTYFVPTMAAGSHTFSVTGDVQPVGNGASYGGTLTIGSPPTSAVPVPAAVWLFGSALVGLMGVSGRKKTLS